LDPGLSSDRTDPGELSRLAAAKKVGTRASLLQRKTDNGISSSSCGYPVWAEVTATTHQPILHSSLALLPWDVTGKPFLRVLPGLLSSTAPHITIKGLAGDSKESLRVYLDQSSWCRWWME
jgi:hypothetical protein